MAKKALIFPHGDLLSIYSCVETVHLLLATLYRNLGTDLMTIDQFQCNYRADFHLCCCHILFSVIPVFTFITLLHFVE